MRTIGIFSLPFLLGLAAGVAALFAGSLLGRRALEAARDEIGKIRDDAQRDAENRRKEILVEAQEKALLLEEENDRRERELEERQAGFDERARAIEREQSELGRQRKKLDRSAESLVGREKQLTETESAATAKLEQVLGEMERVAGLTRDQARAELISGIETDARNEATRIARQIEEEARQNAEREARNLIVQASQRLKLRDVLESTVSFIQLPSDEMKGRIIGKEGRNIRALEMATGIDLIVDDTPRSIWISCFDPLRREIARVAIDRLLEDGRIHPARIEEVVLKVTEDLDALIDEKGGEAAFSLGISDMHPKLLRLIGRTRYHTVHGQNLLQHVLETAQIGGYMAEELGGETAVVRRAGLLHEIGQVAESASEHPVLSSAELCAKYQESEDVVHAIRSLHADVRPTTLDALLLSTANKLSESRPGARKENLSVFIERLKRLEALANDFPGVRQAFAVKAGKELRVIVDVTQTTDESAFGLAKQIARTLEREVAYPGQIKVSVVRETRAVRFAV